MNIPTDAVFDRWNSGGSRRAQVIDRRDTSMSSRVTRESDALSICGSASSRGAIRTHRAFTHALRPNIAAATNERPINRTMSMVTFYLNRAGRRLPAERRRTGTRES
jgi:hypothetical protein